MQKLALELQTPQSTDVQSKSPLSTLRFDAPAGLVVFLIALPLCLGIALASGAPLVSGIIAGIAGGIAVPLISRAPLSVSGPAAGLAAVVLVSIARVGTFQAFALAVVIAGVIQIGLGVLQAGVIADYMPSSVIKGMLTAIGILLILKQLPHAVGFDEENFASLSFRVGEGNTFSTIARAAQAIAPGAVLLSVASLAVLIAWEKTSLKKVTWLPGPLVAVIVATLANVLLERTGAGIALDRQHLVTLPAGEPGDLVGALHLADWSAATQPAVWMVGVTIALVASLETLLNLDAVDRLDPAGRKSPPNRELIAQGAGNILSGLLGGLPITSVIVRSSANVNAGARTRASAFIHGILLLVAVLFAAPLMNRIPLACLATILLVTGYKLAKPKLFSDMYARGFSQFVPFIVTILGIVLTDLLMGVILGLVVGLAMAIKTSLSRSFEVVEEGSRFTIKLTQDAHFFARRKLLSMLQRIPQNAHVVLDAEGARFVDRDVAEAISDFRESARKNSIVVEVRGFQLPS